MGVLFWSDLGCQRGRGQRAKGEVEARAEEEVGRAERLGHEARRGLVTREWGRGVSGVVSIVRRILPCLY